MSLKITVSYILIIFHVFWGHTSRRNKSYLTFSKTITFYCQLQIGTCQQHCLVAPLVKNPPAMRETWVPSLGQEDPLEKGKATHFSSLAWRPPWTVQSMGSQRVGHDCNKGICHLPGFPGGSDGKVSACNVRDQGLIPGPGRSPGEGNRNPLQYSCLENSMDRGAW